MSFLRSSLVAALVSLLFLAGFSFRGLHLCCAVEMAMHAEHHDGDADDKAPLNDEGCKCLCHAIICSNPVEPVRAVAAAQTATESLDLIDERPPETVPLGIDHPPQLG